LLVLIPLRVVVPAQGEWVHVELARQNVHRALEAKRALDVATRQIARTYFGVLLVQEDGKRQVPGITDGVKFRVLTTRRYPKDKFPTDEVYAPTPNAQLRLITCGGAFDRSSGHYRDNIVVYAVLVA